MVNSQLYTCTHIHISNLIYYYTKGSLSDTLLLTTFAISFICRREMDLPPEKRARVCLACKGENGRSNVVF